MSLSVRTFLAFLALVLAVTGVSFLVPVMAQAVSGPSAACDATTVTTTVTTTVATAGEARGC